MKDVCVKLLRGNHFSPVVSTTTSEVFFGMGKSTKLTHENGLSHSIHVWNICLTETINYKHQPNVGKYTIHESYGFYGKEKLTVPISGIDWIPSSKKLLGCPTYL